MKNVKLNLPGKLPKGLAITLLMLLGINVLLPAQGIIVNASCWSSNKIFSDLEYYDSIVYASTNSQGYYMFDMNYNYVIDSITLGTYNPKIMKFEKGRDGNLYAFTDTVIMRKTATGWISTGYTPPGKTLVDDVGNFWSYYYSSIPPWVVTVCMFDGTNTTVFNNPVSSTWITNHAFAADDSGAVWIGSYSGLYRFTPTGFTQYFSGQEIRDIHIDDQSNVYFALDSVLMIRNSSGFSAFNPSIIMPSPWVDNYTTGMLNSTYYVWNTNWSNQHDLLAISPTSVVNVNINSQILCPDSAIDCLIFDHLGRYWMLGLASGFMGHIYTSDTTFGYTLGGKVYHDMNWNGVFDAGDLPLQNIAVLLQPNGTNTYTDALGNFQITLTGAIGLPYFVTQWLPAPWVLTSMPTYYDGILLPNNPVPSFDFGFSTTAPPNYLDVSAFGMIFSRPPGFATDVYLYAQNLSTFPVYSVEAWYELDTLFSGWSSNITPTLAGPDTLYWLIDSLLPLESRVFQITHPLSASVPLGTPFQMKFWVNHPIDTTATNDTIWLSNLVFGSFDPNDKQVHPDRPEKDINPDELLTYTVRFQNIGTAPAVNVVIRDTLSPFLDLSTLHIQGASHPYAIVMNPGNELEINFLNIHLPDSASMPEESVGAITYTIKPLPGLANGVQITNEAYIYFDFNAPILTGKTVSIIANSSIGISKTSHAQLMVWPNPADDILWISCDAFTPGAHIEVHLYDLQGRKIRTIEQPVESNKTSIFTGDLTPGCYIGTFTTNGIPASFRFIKIAR
jgi:uncharacterized repeat protein (TIGR01451 family)